MKVNVFDVAHIINQIKRASPPKDKKTHKLLNNLTILLEKNTQKKVSPLESTFSTTTNKLNETFMELCFLRKEITQKFSQEYFDILAETLLKMKRNNEVLAEAGDHHPRTIAWSLRTMDESNDPMAGIFSKLHKAKGVIEDALQRSSKNDKETSGILEGFFGSH